MYRLGEPVKKEQSAARDLLKYLCYCRIGNIYIITLPPSFQIHTRYLLLSYTYPHSPSLFLPPITSIPVSTPILVCTPYPCFYLISSRHPWFPPSYRCPIFVSTPPPCLCLFVSTHLFSSPSFSYPILVTPPSHPATSTNRINNNTRNTGAELRLIQFVLIVSLNGLPIREDLASRGQIIIFSRICIRACNGKRSIRKRGFRLCRFCG